MNSLRKPYLSLFMASLVLFVSCEQYDIGANPQSRIFDYSLFDSFKENKNLINFIDKLKDKQINRTSSSILEMNRELLSSINLELGTDLTLPDEVLSMSVEMDSDDMELQQKVGQFF